jgi:hypothetical protein
LKPIFVHILGTGNTGDECCSPKRFYSHWADYDERDYGRVPLVGPEPLIIGGGGMLHPGIDAWIQQISAHRKTIVWSIGLNYHQAAPPQGWQAYLDRCKLVGLRDYPPHTGQFFFTPCPTCLAPAFDNCPLSDATRELICYSHYQVPIPMMAVENFTNHLDDTPSIQSFVETIRPYKRVLTNSFHGAYWTMLTGRQPIIWQPFALRFFTALPDSIARVGVESEVEKVLGEAPRTLNLLAKERNATRDFYNIVEMTLAKWGCS